MRTSPQRNQPFHNPSGERFHPTPAKKAAELIKNNKTISAATIVSIVLLGIRFFI